MPYYLIALAAYLIPYAIHWRQLGTADWDIAATWSQIAVWWHQRGDYSVNWNPFGCGGYPLLSHPQIPFFHPSLPLMWAFGPAVGLKLMVLVWMTAGFGLAYAWIRSLGFDRKAALVFAFAWVLNGFFVAHMSVMHAHFVCFFLIPGFYLLIQKWIDTQAYRHLLGLILLILVCSLHSYGFLAYFFLSLPVYFAAAMVAQRFSAREIFKRALPFAAALGSSFVLMAFYLLPVLGYFRFFPRTTFLVFENPIHLILFFPFYLGRAFRSEWPWEYAYFMGPVLFYFALRGLWKIREVPREFIPVLACAAVHCLLAIGSFKALGSPIPSPYDLARDWMPGFSSVRITPRFLIGALPAILLLAVWKWRKQGIGRKSVWLALLPLFAFQLVFAFQFGFARRELGAKKGPPVVDADFNWIEGNPQRMFTDLSSHTGISNCYDSLPIARAKDTRFSGPLVVSGPPGMQLERVQWDQFHLKIDGRSESEAVLNMNHYPGWKFRDGSWQPSPHPTVVSKTEQKLKLAIPKGHVDVVMYYDDPLVFWGRRISAGGLFLVASILALLVGLKSVRW